MADSKKGQTKANDHDEDTLRAGVSVEEEKRVRAEAKEDFEEPAVDEAAAEFAEAEGIPIEDVEEEPLLKEVPEDGAVYTEHEELAATAVQTDVPSVRVVEDEFTGQSGSFVIDAKSGERKRRYEAVRDPKKPDKILGYRPAV